MASYHNGIESLDHPVVAVNDLAAARTTFEKLGFTVPPRGSHVEWGTGNLCIMFPDDYLEMRGIIDSERFVMDLDEHLEKNGEGLMGVAFRTNDVQQSHTALNENGVETAEPRRLTRNFELPEGWTQPSFELCVPARDAIEGLMHVVVLQHLTPELIRRDDFLQHANTAIGVNSMTGTVVDSTRVESKMRRLLGDTAVSRSADEIHLTLPTHQKIHLRNAPGPIDRSTLDAMEIRVADLSQTAAALKANGVESSQPRQGYLRVAGTDCCGVELDFTESPAA